MQPTTPTHHRRQLLGFLGKVDRRLRFNELFGLLTKGLWGLAVVLVLVKLTGVWERPGMRFGVLAAYGLGVVGYLLYRLIAGGMLSRAAVVADHRAELNDTLMSAHAFLGLSDRTDWMNYHIARAAEATESLDPAELAPASLPRPFFPALAVAFVLVAMFSWNPVWLQELDAPSLFSRGEDEEAETMAEILDEAEVLPEEQAALEELGESIEELRHEELEVGESLGDLGEAQEALRASRVDMEQFEIDLDEIAANLDPSESLTELSEALKSHDAEEVAELLRELAERLAETQSSEELQALLEALSRTELQQADLAEMMESLESAGGEMSPEGLAKMAEALLEAADRLEQMGQQMASDGPMSQEHETASLESSQAQEPSSSQQQPGDSPPQPGDASQSASGAMSAQMQMAQMQGEPTAAVPMDAGPAGEATGPGGGESEVLGEATSLDVQLEMEVLEKAEREEPVPEEIFERLSREEKSTLNYEVIRQRTSYAEENALTQERVPWRYRTLVKRYFMSLVAISETKAESSEEK